MKLHNKRPVHERIKLLGRLRSWLRNHVFGLLRKWLATDEGRAAVTETIRGIGSQPPVLVARAFDSPYPDLGAATQRSAEIPASCPIFVTARFRSGSTLLWNIFRHAGGCTAYYEPFNERRWFDPKHRGARVDGSHRGVRDYWREYEGLSDLDAYYREEWTSRHLYMAAEFSDVQMYKYLSALIAQAPDRPVLQFNRIDFRLPWIRRHFPEARLVHLYRHPRDQWYSTFMGAEPCPRDVNISHEDFARYDKFYLLRWVRDLRYRFTFLDDPTLRHPYQWFYLIWKLSYAFGQTYADYSLDFESLAGRPEEVLPELFAQLDIDQYDLPQICTLIEPPREGAWSQYADEAWFSQHESQCEQILREFFPVREPVTAT